MSAAGVLYRADGKFLLLKRRANSIHGGTWGLPAGKIDAGETPEQAAFRECFEETQHQITTPLIFVSIMNGFSLFKTKGEMFTPVLNEEHTDYVWATVTNLPSPLHPDLDIQITEATMDSNSSRIIDQNDYLYIEKNPVSREGVFPYLGAMIGAEKKDKIYYVYRPADELADIEAIKSFQTIPIIDDHEMLGSPDKGFTAPENKETHGTTGENVVFENGVLYANLKIFSQKLQKLIQEGKKDLSLGYRAVYEKAEGFYNGQAYQFIQRRLRGNHLALVDEGRSAVSVLDEADFKFTSDSVDLASCNKEIKMADENKDEPKGEKTLDALYGIVEGLAGKIDALSVNTKDEKDEDEKEKKTEDADDSDKKDEKETKDEDDKKKDEDTMDTMAEVKALRAKIEALETNGLKAHVSQISQRDALVSKLSPIVGTFDHADKTLGEVAKYGAEKLGLKVASGQELAALDGYFAATKAQSTVSFAMDSKAKMPELDAYLNKSNA